MNKRILYILISVSLIICIAYLILFIKKLNTVDYASPNFMCKTNIDCREWAKFNNKKPGIMCIGGYTCGEQGVCKFECGADY
jgi:hypothetical protein